MKKVFFSLFITFVFLTFFISCSPEVPVQNIPDESVEKGSIEGKALFRNSDNSEGIIIVLEATDGLRSERVCRSSGSSFLRSGDVSGTCKTDAAGKYSFSDIDCGTYTIYAASENSTEKAVMTNVTVKKNNVSIPDDIYLTATGAVKGRIILDESENGNYGFSVFIGGTSYLAKTSDSGDFEITGIPAKNGYEFYIEKGDYDSFWVTTDVKPSQKTDLGIKKITSEIIRDGNNAFEWKGSFASEDEIMDPKKNWAYFNSTKGCSYIYDGEKWTLLASKGDNGGEKRIGLYKVVHKIKYYDSEDYVELYPEQLKVGYVGELTNAESTSVPKGYHSKEIEQLIIEENNQVEVVVKYEVNDMRKYTVHHWLQNVDLTTYSECEKEVLEWHYGLNSAASEKRIEGFVSKDISQVEVLEDGSSEVNIFYDRNEVKITFLCIDYYDDTVGNYVEPVEYGFTEISGFYGIPVVYDKEEIIKKINHLPAAKKINFDSIPDVFPKYDQLVYLDVEHKRTPELIKNGFEISLGENYQRNLDEDFVFEMEWDYDLKDSFSLDECLQTYLIDKSRLDNYNFFRYVQIEKIKIGNNKYKFSLGKFSLWSGHEYEVVFLLQDFCPIHLAKEYEKIDGWFSDYYSSELMGHVLYKGGFKNGPDENYSDPKSIYLNEEELNENSHVYSDVKNVLMFEYESGNCNRLGFIIFGYNYVKDSYEEIRWIEDGDMKNDIYYYIVIPEGELKNFSSVDIRFIVDIDDNGIMDGPEEFIDGKFYNYGGYGFKVD